MRTKWSIRSIFMPARRLDLPDRFSRFLAAAARHDNPRALARKGQCRRPADAGIAAGDKGHFAVE